MSDHTYQKSARILAAATSNRARSVSLHAVRLGLWPTATCAKRPSCPAIEQKQFGPRKTKHVHTFARVMAFAGLGGVFLEPTAQDKNIVPCVTFGRNIWSVQAATHHLYAVTLGYIMMHNNDFSERKTSRQAQGSHCLLLSNSHNVDGPFMGPAHPVFLALAIGVVGCTVALRGWLQGVLRPLGISPSPYAPSPALLYKLPKFTHLAIMYRTYTAGLWPLPVRIFTAAADAS